MSHPLKNFLHSPLSILFGTKTTQEKGSFSENLKKKQSKNQILDQTFHNVSDSDRKVLQGIMLLKEIFNNAIDLEAKTLERASF